MKHLDALCCDACRAKVAAIEARVHASPDRFVKLNAEAVVQAFADRKELLAMVEHLLSTVATKHANLRRTEALMLRLIELSGPLEKRMTDDTRNVESWTVAYLTVRSLRRMLALFEAMGREEWTPGTLREMDEAPRDAKASLAVAAKHGFGEMPHG